MLNLIMKDVLGTPAILVGLFALLGLVLQKKGLTEVVSGTLKTIMGFIILGVGANVLVGTLNSFGAMFEHAFHIKRRQVPAHGVFWLIFLVDINQLFQFGSHRDRRFPLALE